MRKLQDLVVWQKGNQFVMDMFDLSQKFGLIKRFGLANQLEKAALSITNNIAEGIGRMSYRDERKFFIISRGSAFECYNMLLLCKTKNLITKDEFEKWSDLLEQIIKMLNGYIRNLNARIDQ